MICIIRTSAGGTVSKHARSASRFDRPRPILDHWNIRDTRISRTSQHPNCWHLSSEQRFLSSSSHNVEPSSGPHVKCTPKALCSTPCALIGRQGQCLTYSTKSTLYQGFRVAGCFIQDKPFCRPIATAGYPEEGKLRARPGDFCKAKTPNPVVALQIGSTVGS